MPATRGSKKDSDRDITPEVKDNLAYLPGVLVAISLHKKDLESYDEL